MSKKAKITTGILVAAGAVAVILILVFAVFTGKKVKLSDYISVNYKGVNNYATAEISIEKDELYSALTDGEEDTELKDLAKQYVDTVSYTHLSTDKSYPGDNRLITPKSSHRRSGLAPRCRLIASWGCSRSHLKESVCLYGVSM